MAQIMLWLPRDWPGEALILPTDLDRLRATAELVIQPFTEAPIDAAQVIRQSAQAEIVISTWGAPPYTREVLAGCPRLQLFARLGGSLRWVIDPQAWQRGIKVITAARQQGVVVAELTLTLILAGTHRLWCYARQQWSDNAMSSLIEGGRVSHPCLLEKRVALLGFGAVARELTRMLKPLNCRITAYDPFVDASLFAELGVERVESPLELCRECDVLSIHATYNEQTAGLVSAELIDALPHGALLVNTSYGELLDTPALLRRAQAGELFACLDMQVGGPPPPGDPLRTCENILVTPTILPHSGAVQLMGREIVDDVLRHLRGEALQHEISGESLAHRA